MHLPNGHFNPDIVIAWGGDPATQTPLVPSWLAVSMALVLLFFLLLHMAWIQRADMPASRRRIRIVNGWLMLAAIPLLTYAFGIAIPSKARSFVLVWAASVGVIGIIVMLAVLDMLNNWRIHHRARTRLRADMDVLVKHRSGGEGGAGMRGDG